MPLSLRRDSATKPSQKSSQMARVFQVDQDPDLAAPIVGGKLDTAHRSILAQVGMSARKMCTLLQQVSRSKGAAAKRPRSLLLSIA
jgi:hypothetical protein